MSPPKQVNQVNSLVLKESDSKLENLSLLIRLSVSDGGKQTVQKFIINGVITLPEMTIYDTSAFVTFMTPGLKLRVPNKKSFSYISTKTYVVGIQKNCLNE